MMLNSKQKNIIVNNLNFFFKNFPIQLLKNIYTNSLFPFYHYVGNNLDLSKHLYETTSLKKFKQDVFYLNKHYKSISLNTIIDSLKVNRNLPKKSFHISFDDGMSRNFETAIKFLKPNKINATFFVVKNFIDNKEMFYRHKASLIIEKSKNHHISTIKKGIVILKDNKLFKGDLNTSILNISYKDKKIYDYLGEVFEIDFDNYLKKYKPYMSSDQINILIENGFSIGAHSIDHPKLQELNIENQIKQIENSIEFISSTFKINSRIFAVPFTDENLHEKL